MEVFVLSSHEYNFSNNNKQPIFYVYMKGNKKNGKIESIRVIVLGSTTYNESEKVFFGKEGLRKDLSQWKWKFFILVWWVVVVSVDR